MNNNMKIKILIASVVFSLATACYVTYYCGLACDKKEPSLVIPPCLTDEAHETDTCYWNGSTMGDNIGGNYIVVEGEVYYPE